MAASSHHYNNNNNLHPFNLKSSGYTLLERDEERQRGKGNWNFIKTIKVESDMYDESTSLAYLFHFNVGQLIHMGLDRVSSNIVDHPLYYTSTCFLIKLELSGSCWNEMKN